MKHALAHLKTIGAIALLILAASCAGDLHEKENLAVAAGFKTINPTNANQTALLTTLPADQVSRITHEGKTYYVLPDAKNNQAYVGGPKQHQAYQQLRLAKQISNENLEAAEMNETAAMNWGGWGGWGGDGWY